MKTYDLVQIWWIDSQAGNSWTGAGELTDPQPIPAAGYLINETSKSITLCISIDENDEGVPTLTIPKCAIKKRRVLCKTKIV